MHLRIWGSALPLILPDSYIGENSGINLSPLEDLSENAKSFIKENKK